MRRATLALTLASASGLVAPPALERLTAPLATGLRVEWLRQQPAEPTSTPPVLFVHGTFHGAWCWAEHWMPYFAAAQIDCHAVSLRGTEGSPIDSAKVKTSEHVADLRAFVDEFLSAPPVIVGHSYGGAFLLKYLEAGGAAAGAALLCSVPPSGNGPMTGRYLRRMQLSETWRITRGFALKAAATDADLARELFFDDKLPDADLTRYLRNFAADSTCSLDLGEFVSSLPSKRADGASGRAEWLPRAPPALVLGAARDAIVDAEGVAESARFLGVEPRVLDLPHDVMLADGWEAAADEVLGWYRKVLSAPKLG